MALPLSLQSTFSRSEFWYFNLFYCLIGLALVLVDGIISNILGFGGFLSVIYYLAAIIPALAVTIRRLHDTGRSGWWILISLVPLIGPIVLLIFFLQSSDFERNQYGPSPKPKPMV